MAILLQNVEAEEKKKEILLPFLNGKTEQLLLKQRYLLGLTVSRAGWWTEESLLQLDSGGRFSPSVPFLGTGLPQVTRVAEPRENPPKSLADTVCGGCDCWKPYTSNCVKLTENRWQKILWSQRLSKALLVYYRRQLSLSSSAPAFPRFQGWSIWGPPAVRSGGNHPCHLHGFVSPWSGRGRQVSLGTLRTGKV